VEIDAVYGAFGEPDEFNACVRSKDADGFRVMLAPPLFDLLEGFLEPIFIGESIQDGDIYELLDAEDGVQRLVLVTRPETTSIILQVEYQRFRR